MFIFRVIEIAFSDFWWAALFTLGRGVCDIHLLRFNSSEYPVQGYQGF